ncbi:MAG: ATP-binding protein, partial [Bacteroidetes bacterium]
MKIKTIQFQDYRAFYNGEDEQYLIKTEEKNVLIYGENGSGKTSFFRGLKDFIQSAHSELSSEIDFTLHNRASTGEGFVKVTFSDDTEDVFDEAGTKATKTEVAEASQINTFLSYKELLRTHLLDLQEGEAVNLFPLLINRQGILWNYEVQSGQTPILVSNLIAEFDANTYTNVQIFIDVMKNLVENDINDKLDNFLSYFEQGLEVELEFLATQDTSSVYHFSIIPRVYLFDNPIENHQNFLNEARLSALALSIYLSAIASNPTGNTLKCLFLDDVFIGLDMSNRLPLLDILKTEFADYQIFMTTYDRHWFEVAKRYLPDWQHIEMYVGKN